MRRAAGRQRAQGPQDELGSSQQVLQSRVVDGDEPPEAGAGQSDDHCSGRGSHYVRGCSTLLHLMYVRMSRVRHHRRRRRLVAHPSLGVVIPGLLMWGFKNLVFLGVHKNLKTSKVQILGLLWFLTYCITNSIKMISKYELAP